MVEIAIKRKTGARALRSIMETIMTEIMYEVPSLPDLERCIITRQTVESGAKPEMSFKAQKKRNAG